MPDPDQLLACPLEKSDCHWLDEIRSLRQQVVELSELVLTDALTDLYNYRHFKYVLQAEMDRSKRSGIPTTLVMIDLDHFKQINDNYGHEVGNTILKKVSSMLKSEVRTTDVVCRYGGEEFAIIFAETHLYLAVKVAERIRKAVSLEPVDCDGCAVNVTASMGASVYLKSSVLSIDDFIDSVDKYLYEAKTSGRNCICHIDYQGLSQVTEVGADERAMLFGRD
ncbi:MAG: GGDEF domain-containing protein [Gammaproteobacteria bacterium]|nr:GGDEF domain-containing protein [Gammaproteobacteria bacterium]